MFTGGFKEVQEFDKNAKTITLNMEEKVENTLGKIFAIYMNLYFTPPKLFLVLIIKLKSMLEMKNLYILKFMFHSQFTMLLMNY